MKFFSSTLLLSIALAIFPGFTAGQETKFTLAGLSSPVTVRYDGRGIPYIEAANERDLYFVQGYVTAGDRLWQMDLLRRAAAGETAEIFGKVALEEDKRWRRMGFAAVARESLKHLSPQLRQALESYAAGVNAKRKPCRSNSGYFSTSRESGSLRTRY